MTDLLSIYTDWRRYTEIIDLRLRGEKKECEVENFKPLTANTLSVFIQVFDICN